MQNVAIRQSMVERMVMPRLLEYAVVNRTIDREFYAAGGMHYELKQSPAASSNVASVLSPCRTSHNVRSIKLIVGSPMFSSSQFVWSL